MRPKRQIEPLSPPGRHEAIRNLVTAQQSLDRAARKLLLLRRQAGVLGSPSVPPLREGSRAREGAAL
ncbi:MAG TPA: hypothetical protein VFG53_09490 [Anaeromyxobacter sp.]|nr:hypothetical protein [Anaeromyxobacter sp.]